MSELTDLVLSVMDPVEAVLLAVVAYYARSIKIELRDELRRNRKRVERLEETHMPDGGSQ